MIEGGSLLDGLPDAVRRALADRLQPRSLQGGEDRRLLGGSSRSTEMPDVLVRPDVERFAILDVGRFDELVAQGHREAPDTLGERWGARAA